jgi:hypothetical protein
VEPKLVPQGSHTTLISLGNFFVVIPPEHGFRPGCSPLTVKAHEGTQFGHASVPPSLRPGSRVASGRVKKAPPGIEIGSSEALYLYPAPHWHQSRSDGPEWRIESSNGNFQKRGGPVETWLDGSPSDRRVLWTHPSVSAPVFGGRCLSVPILGLTPGTESRPPLSGRRSTRDESCFLAQCSPARCLRINLRRPL